MDLILENLVYSYPGSRQAILRGLSAKFSCGAITALTGLNGCGKTTLVKNIVGILRPKSGRILLGGSDLTSLSIARIGRKIGCLLQNPSCQLFSPTVEEEIAYGLNNQGLSRALVRKKTDYYLDYFQLSPYRGRFPFHLSRGEKQRLVLAAVLAMEPDYVLLDEPTASLDAYWRKNLGKYLRKIQKDGCGVILVSHDSDFVEEYAGVELIMEQGVISKEINLADGRIKNGADE